MLAIGICSGTSIYSLFWLACVLEYFTSNRRPALGSSAPVELLTGEDIFMRALLSTQVGGPKKLVVTEEPDPVPSEDEVGWRVNG
jgi:hypothetical protein